MLEDILYRVEAGVARITLNRPDRRNALRLQTQIELAQALWEADDDARVHCAVIDGAGPSFCAGYDLGEYGRDDGRRLDPDADRRGFREIDDDIWQLERAQRLRMAVFDMHKPVIAKVHGHCLAGGTDVALLCDMVIAAEDALFAFPPARDLGSLPNQMWVYHVGPQWAKRLLLTGDSVTGRDAASLGLVMKAVPAAALDAEVDALVRRLVLIDPHLLSLNKRSVNLAMELMGARTMQRLAAELDARGHNSRAARGFRESLKRDGLRATLDSRDAAFGRDPVRVDGPDIRPGGDGA